MTNTIICQIIGTPSRSRTENTLPFERSDFAKFVQGGMVATAGLEPATQEFSVLCSTIGAM